MSRISNAHTISIAAAATTSLGIAAQGTASNSFTQFMLNSADQNSALGFGTQTGSMIPYCNTMVWNDLDRRIEIISRDHTDPPYDAGYIRESRYTETANANSGDWEFITRYAPIAGHGFDHVSINPHTWDVYVRNNNGGDVIVYRRPRDSLTLTTITAPSGTYYSNVAVGTTYWSGAMTGMGAHGCWMCYAETDSNSYMYFYDPLSATWSLQSGVTPGTSGYLNSYNYKMEYSSVKNVAVYGGGNNHPSMVWKMDSNKVATRLADIPASMGGMRDNTLFWADPATGNFMLMGATYGQSSGQLYELNPDGTGTWTLLKDRGQIPSPIYQVANSTGHLLSCAIPISRYGVTALITQTNQFNGNFYLYRR